MCVVSCVLCVVCCGLFAVRCLLLVWVLVVGFAVCCDVGWFVGCVLRVVVVGLTWFVCVFVLCRCLLFVCVLHCPLWLASRCRDCVVVVWLLCCSRCWIGLGLVCGCCCCRCCCWFVLWSVFVCVGCVCM